MLEDEIKSFKEQFNINSNKTKDAIYILIFSIISFSIFIYIDAFELFVEYSREHEEYELDEIVLLLFISGFSTLWYSIRRYKEIKKIQEKFKSLNTLLEEKLKIEIEKSNEILANKNKELELKVQKAVKEVKEQNTMLNQQSKMAAMGKMLESITHQWRQPLSAITISASGIQLQQEFGEISKKEIVETCDNIISNCEHLSDTIDDFRNFFKKDKEQSAFDIKNVYQKTFKLINSSFRNKHIKIIDHIETVELLGHPNELIQVFINILNNSKDELIKIKDEKLIFIDIKKIDENIIIKIKDTAKGAPAEVLPSIFNPYFTTKGDDGTGIGLYMSKKIIADSFNGTMEANNLEFTYKDKQYFGLEITITIPLLEAK